jgi:hypothetical protein
MLATPTLTASKTSSNLGTFTCSDIKNCFTSTKIGLLRQRGLKEQRRLNKTMACCDYDAAEAALHNDVQGQVSNARLCIYCLGAETQ